VAWPTWLGTIWPIGSAGPPILSPGDETRDKLPFYAAHQVDEVVIVDPEQRSVEWLALHEGRYAPVQRSGLIDLARAALADRIDWPPSDPRGSHGPQSPPLSWGRGQS